MYHLYHFYLYVHLPITYLNWRVHLLYLFTFFRFISLVSTRTLSSIEWVQADVAYRANTDQHRLWKVSFALPFLLIWSLVFPLLLFLAIFLQRHRLNTIDNRFKWGYFYNEYKIKVYFWEFVKIFQKELMIIILSVYDQTVIIKGLLIFLTVFFYGVLNLRYRPY